jgi:N-ethylmaleimide reductase
LLFDAAPVAGRKATTDAVQAQGGKIFGRFRQCGRWGNVASLPARAEVIGPGTAPCPGEMFTEGLGMQPSSPPRATAGVGIERGASEHAMTASLALYAGLDGVELHGAHGSLV